MSITVSSRTEVLEGVELGVLGPFRALSDGQWRDAPTKQIARVGTILAGWPGEPIERDRIVAALWGETTPATVANTLQVHVSGLRRLIGKRTVRCQGTNYILDVAPEAIDAEQLVERIHEATRMRRLEHYGRAAELLDEAVRLFRGSPFPDVADPDLEARRALLAEMHVQAREDLVECRLELARDRFELAEVVAEAKGLVSRDPVRAKGHVLLVRALSAADRAGEASAAFDAASRHLRTNYGLDPGPELADIHARGLARDPDLLPKAMRSIRVLSDGRNDRTAGSDDRHANDDGATDVAAKVREYAVDIGARQITLRTDTVTGRLLDTIALELADDFLVGVIVATGDAQPKDVVWAAVGADTEIEVTDWEDIEGLDRIALVCDNTGAAGPFKDLARHLGTLRRQPVLVNVGPRTLDLPSEVVIDAYEAAIGTRRSKRF